MEFFILATVLSGLYLATNDDQKKETFVPGAPYERLKEDETKKLQEQKQNNIVQDMRVVSENNAKLHPEQPVDNQIHSVFLNKKEEKKEIKENTPSSSKESFLSLSGNMINVNDFKHSNMKPYFGSSVRQSHVDRGHIMDYHTGDGSTYIRKKEIGSLFSPQSDMKYINGAPNQNELFRSRVNPSMMRTNEKPFQEIRVAPSSVGAGMDGSQGVGGFNSGIMGRDTWMPKSVDNLRVLNNPKKTYEGQVLGPKSAIHKPGIQGKVEKNRPDTYYVNTPERYFTTPVDKGPTVRSKNILKAENRIMTTAEHFGGPSALDNQQSSYTKGVYETPKRPELDADIKHMSNLYQSSQDRCKLKDIQYYKNCQQVNNRNTVENNHLFGSLATTMKAVLSPITDVLKPTRKEDYIQHPREHGNAGSTVPMNPLLNPSHAPNVTIREFTERESGHRFIGKQSEGAYLTSMQTPVDQQRDSTSYERMGNASGSRQSRVYDTEYNANLIDKTPLLHERSRVPSNVSMFNSNINLAVNKENKELMYVPRQSVQLGSNVPSKEMIGSNSNLSNFTQIESLKRNDYSNIPQDNPLRISGTPF